MQYSNYNDLEKLIGLKKQKDINRQGILFKTKYNNYFYDTGTGKVILLDSESKIIIQALLDKEVTVEEFTQVLFRRKMREKANELIKFIEKENILSNAPIDHFLPLGDYLSEENMKCEQIIIELTGNCNLRCKYCIYNQHYTGNRNFNTSNIDFETARKGMEFVYRHRDSEQLAITFYGGEPLMNYSVMKQCIDYALENFTDCNLSFSFTTNLTLMTEERAEYLAQIPNLSILISIDGPEEIHNAARVYKNNMPTFSDAFRGLQTLSKAVNKYQNTSLIFNSVLMPPYTRSKFEEINSFFESLNFLPENTKVQATYPSPGSIPEHYYKEKERSGSDPYVDSIDWISWAKEKATDKPIIKNRRNLYSTVLETSLVRIHNRPLYDKPLGINFQNGCCIPGQRRLYLCTDGTYKICERIGNSPSIGNVKDGINLNAIKKYYLSDYEDASLEDCSKCWAIHLCDLCFASCYEKNGINIETKKSLCGEVRSRFKRWLSEYYETLECNPKRIEEISDIKVV